MVEAQVMGDSIGDILRKQRESSERQAFRMAMGNARNTMRAVKIMIEEGEYDEAIEAISKALGEGE